MELEGIVLSEISQRKTNTVWSHLYRKFKKDKTNTDTENILVVARSKGYGESRIDKSGQNVLGM